MQVGRRRGSAKKEEIKGGKSRPLVKENEMLVSSYRFQIWPLDKKLRVIRTAKDYVKRHESELEEKLAQNRTFRGVITQTKIQIIKFLTV